MQMPNEFRLFVARSCDKESGATAQEAYLYSLPHTHVRRPVTLTADPQTVRLLDGGVELARHARSYDTNAVIEDPAHLAALVTAKAAARPVTARDRLLRVIPATAQLFADWATRGDTGLRDTRRLLDLLDTYGPAELTGRWTHPAVVRGVARTDGDFHFRYLTEIVVERKALW